MASEEDVAPPRGRGLAAHELPADDLRAGDTVEYYSPAFVAGDPRGHCLATVVRVALENVDYPVFLDSNELLSRYAMVKRKKDIHGNILNGSHWRKLRTYNLVDSRVDIPRRSTRLSSGLRTVINDAFAAVRAQLHDDPDVVAGADEEADAVAAADLAPTDPEGQNSQATPALKPITTPARPDAAATVILNSSDEDDGECRLLAVVPPLSPRTSEGEELGVVKREPLPKLAGQAAEGFAKIRTRKEVNRDGHRRKSTKNSWHVARSRKKCYQKKCVTVRDAKNVCHAHTLKARFVEEFIKHPSVGSASASAGSSSFAFQI